LQLHLVLTPRCCGELHIDRLAFRLASAASSLLPDPVVDAVPNTIAGFVTLEVQGPRLNNTKSERTGLFYAPDRRLSPLITDQLPKLEVIIFSAHCHHRRHQWRALLWSVAILVWQALHVW